MNQGRGLCILWEWKAQHWLSNLPKSVVATLDHEAFAFQHKVTAAEAYRLINKERYRRGISV